MIMFREDTLTSQRCPPSPEMPWSAPFDEPIRPRGGLEVSTLQHAADDIMKLPEAVQHEERWQIASKT